MGNQVKHLAGRDSKEADRRGKLRIWASAKCRAWLAENYVGRCLAESYLTPFMFSLQGMEELLLERPGAFSVQFRNFAVALKTVKDQMIEPVAFCRP